MEMDDDTLYMFDWYDTDGDGTMDLIYYPLELEKTIDERSKEEAADAKDYDRTKQLQQLILENEKLKALKDAETEFDTEVKKINKHVSSK